MLPLEQSLPFSNYAELYDMLVPLDNDLRRMNDLVDFSFIRSELSSKYCLDNGRTAEDPVRLFKYLLLKVIFDLSDVDVVARSLYDLSFKYFLGMPPEQTRLIEPSTLCQFRRLRLRDNDLMGLLIGRTVAIAREKGVIKSRTIIVDATHTGSRSNPMSVIEVLRLRSRQLRKSLYDLDGGVRGTLPAKNSDSDLDHELAYCRRLLDEVSSTHEALTHTPRVRERMNMLEEVMSDIDAYRETLPDIDARVGHKSRESSFYGYKTHIAMSDERIITAATVTSGEKGDGPQLGELVRQSRANGMEVDTVVGDTAYSGSDNIALSQDEEEGFELVSRLNPVISNGRRSGDDGFEYNKDAGMMVCPAGHMAVRRYTDSRGGGGRSPRVRYYFDIGRCRVCPKRDGCYRAGASSKSYVVTIRSDLHRSHEEFQNTDAFKTKAKVRYKIEAKNAELKNVLGYDRALSYGLDCMRMQGAVTIFVANVRRILRLLH